MLIDLIFRRFGPVYAMDGEGGGVAPTGGAAAEVAAIVGAGGETEAEPEFELPDDVNVGEGEPEPEFEDYDLDGVKVKVPKNALQAVKDAAYRQSDYTKKTQTAAEKVKEAETAKANYEARAAEDDTFREGVFHLRNIDNDLATRAKWFDSPEYKALEAEDPVQAQSLYNKFSRDEKKRTDLANALGRMQFERNSKAADEAKAQAETSSRLREQALQTVAKKIHGWNVDLQAKVRASALSSGYAPEAIDGITDPVHWETLYYADIGRRAFAQRARTGAGAARIQAVPGSTRTVGQGGGNPGNVVAKLDKASPDDYVAMRRQQMAKK